MSFVKEAIIKEERPYECLNNNEKRLFVLDINQFRQQNFFFQLNFLPAQQISQKFIQFALKNIKHAWYFKQGTVDEISGITEKQ